MKKLSFIAVALLANISLISCTSESIADVMGTPDEQFATDGESESTDPEEEPPTGGKG